MTGGAGFLGYHLSKKLAEKHNVIIIDNFSRGKHDKDFSELIEHPNVEFIQLDMGTYKNFEKLDKDFDIIFHLAARNGTVAFYDTPYEVARTNLLSLVHVLDWLGKEEINLKKFIWTSSSETYAQTPNIPIPTPENVSLTINDVFNPRLSYAGSKIMGEILVTNYSRMYNLPFIILRPHNIFGERAGQDHVIPEMIQRIISKENPFALFGGNETRSFCYVSDFVDGAILSAFVAEPNQIYNIGNPTETKIIDLAYLMFELFNHHPKLKILPTLKGSTTRRCPDITKLSKLGYQPKVSLKEGLLKTYEWYSHA